MKVAIIIFLALSIIGTGYITINDIKHDINWFALIALVLYIATIL